LSSFAEGGGSAFAFAVAFLVVIPQGSAVAVAFAVAFLVVIP
jgi:hypothetical protein